MCGSFDIMETLYPKYLKMERSLQSALMFKTDQLLTITQRQLRIRSTLNDKVPSYKFTNLPWEKGIMTALNWKCHHHHDNFLVRNGSRKNTSFKHTYFMYIVCLYNNNDSEEFINLLDYINFTEIKILIF